MATKPNFHADLAVGQAGERELIALAAKHNVVLTQTDGRKGDLLDVDGNLWEVKSDGYDHDRTVNFFLEIMSDVDKGKLGGPAQALMNNCKYYAYFFVKNRIAYIFDTADLIEQMKRVNLGQQKQIRNVRWTTIGYATPRSLFKPLFVWKTK